MTKTEEGMTQRTNTDAVTRSVLVPLAPDEAFELFVDRFDTWWPRDSHHIAEADAAEVFLDARPGGRWYERADDGTECDWGQVMEVDRPNRILLAWQLTPEWRYDPDTQKATHVEVVFSAKENGTAVTLTHSGFEVHGEPGAAMRESVGGDGGWGSLMELYRNAA
jgi:uncharacterized protein YndB with AHSA1/START domain